MYLAAKNSFPSDGPPGDGSSAPGFESGVCRALAFGHCVSAVLVVRKENRMNSDEYSEKLKRQAFRDMIEWLVLTYLMGAVCVGVWLLGILDPLPTSIFSDLNPENKSFV